MNTINQERLSDLLSTATYGNAWPEIEIPEYSKELIANDDIECIEDKWAAILMKGGKLILHDLFNSYKRHEVTLDILVKGLDKLHDLYPKYWHEIQDEEEDFYSADAWLQVSILGDIFYG